MEAEELKTKTVEQCVSLFKNLMSGPSRAVRLEEVLRQVKYDRDVAYKTEAFRKMAAVLGKDKANEEVKKKKVPAFSVAVLFDGNGRDAANVLGFTGLALCDIDGLAPDPISEQSSPTRSLSPRGEGSEYSGGDGVTVEEAFEKVKADPHTLMVYRTISGDGLRVIYRYVRGGSPLPHQGGVGGGSVSWPAAYLKGNRYFAELVGHEYDGQCSDYSRLSGLAHDEGVYVNWEAVPFVITDEEVLAANFDGQGERGKARKEYAVDSCTATVEEAWERVEKSLAKRGMSYRAGQHHDYVMHAAFLMNRYGVDVDNLLTWAEQHWADYAEREATIRSCYKKTEQHGTWRLNLQGRKAKESSLMMLTEIRAWLSKHVEVVENEVTDQKMWRPHTQPLSQGEGAEMRPLDDRAVCTILGQIEADSGKRVLKRDLTNVLNSDFARLYHPVREYIEALPPWDGQDRVKELCGHVRPTPDRPTPDPSLREGGIEAPSGAVGGAEYFEWTLHKWLVAMVATWMSDLASNHEIFVLIGPQGIYKTTFFRHLLPPELRSYFWENAHNSFSTKDDHLALSENCLVEIEEIDMQNMRDISELKALVTSQKVKERRPYAEFREEKHRLASFCGSGNQGQFLSDETGSRRWLCHHVGHIDDPRTWGLDYDQLYAQLRDELQRGFRYWFDADEQWRVEQHNEQFRIESTEEQLIRSRLRRPLAGEKVTRMNAGMICQYLSVFGSSERLTTRKVGLVMRRLGYKKVHTRAGEFYEVYQIPQDQIQAALAMLDDEPAVYDSVEMTEGNLPF